MRSRSIILLAALAIGGQACGGGGSTGSGGDGGTGGTSTAGTGGTDTTSSGGSGTGGTGGSGAAGGTGGSGGMTTGSGGMTTGSGGSGGSQAIAVTLAFEGRVGAEKFDCATTFTGVGTPPADIKITDYRLYVHDVALHATDGTLVPVELDQDGLWQTKNLALLDFEDGSGSCANGTPETNAVIKGTAPAGTYDGVAFKVGVPFDMNHQDAALAPSPLNLTAMFWNWQFGYKFLRVDAVPVGAADSFNLHLGSTGCMDDGMGGVSMCARPNVPQVSLMGFDPLKTTILVDYAALVAKSDLTKNLGDAPGCMSGETDPECASVFSALGIDIADGSIHPDEQLFFRAE